MKISYAYNTEDCKPSILEVAQAYLQVRRAGKEYLALCPFHADKNPSLSINEEKGLFHCFACGTSGDVIRFVELIENISFKEACARLKLDTFTPKLRPHRTEAEKVARWAHDTSRKICDALLEIGDEIRVCSLARKQPDADKALIAEHEADLIRRWAILEDFDDDLNNPERRLLAHAKSSVAALQPTIEFFIDSDGGFRWGGETADTADDALGTGEPKRERESRQLDAATRFLQDVLSNGPMPSNDVKEKALAAGVSWRTIWRAKELLDVHSSKARGTGEWFWRLDERGMKVEKLVRLSHEELRALAIPADEVWTNNLYRVAVKRVAGDFVGKTIVQLTIKRHDDTPVHSWSDFQAIKNQIVGEECEGVELYPAKSRCIDQLNRYHLWVVSEAGFLFPIGWNEPAASFDDTTIGKIDEED